MLTKKMEDAFVQHINKEMHSAYIYMSMSTHSTFIGLKGFAAWFMSQYHEEMFHAMKMVEYVQSQGCNIKLTAIADPLSGFESSMDMFEKTLAHEQYMTANINKLVDLTMDEKDHASKIFLHWYVTEQVEEEDTVNDIIAKLKLIGDDANALLTIDKELGARVVTVPTDFSTSVTAQAKAG